ncbi:hypothetical protein [Paludifilum halophilum]|uniref:Uncharacterized protein n=1 Tax=Paludifilum halophilum TaxID=1642702 RepID=A0A235B9M5_9BACL|nr:hypothetical protein [Paludifilum halophilum]OYD08966.1 hypothetical protein CHM34_04100 [Paludifilum halophilum]
MLNRKTLGKKVALGAVVCLVLSLLFSLMISPSAVQLEQEEGESPGKTVPLSPGLYWIGVIGFTVWFMALGLLLFLIVSLVVWLWKGMKRKEG